MTDYIDTTVDSLNLSNDSSDKKKHKKVPIEIKVNLSYEESSYSTEDYVTNDLHVNNEEEPLYTEKVRMSRADKLESDKQRRFSDFKRYDKITKTKRGEKDVRNVYHTTERKINLYSNEYKEIQRLMHQNKIKNVFNNSASKLVEDFAKVDLFAFICSSAREFSFRLDDSNKSFLIDLIRMKHFSYFKIYLGEDSQIFVSDINLEHKQLVLYIKEPQRTFAVKSWDYIPETGKRKMRITYNTTPAEERRILIGNDEDHPFMCILPELVYTIEDAHECLKPEEIKRMRKDQFIRQGEWFLVETNKFFPERMGKKKKGVANGKGREHKVTSLVDLGEKDDDIKDKEMYFKGYMSHPDHKNVISNKWMRIYSNTEIIQEPIKGSTWID